MILSRLENAIREQNWFAVTLEVCIVVLGVFLGIQLGNWNAARADSRLGQAYIERLIADLHQDRQTRQIHAAYYAAVEASGERTIALMAAPDEDLALVIHAYRATEYVGSAQKRATWDEILFSGKAGLLPGAARDEAGDYFADDRAADWQNGAKEAPYRRLVRSKIPHALQRAIRERCGDVRDDRMMVVGFRSDCDLDVDPAVVAAAASVLRAEPRVLEELRYHLAHLSSLQLMLLEELGRIDRVIAALGGDPSEGEIPDNNE